LVTGDLIKSTPREGSSGGISSNDLQGQPSAGVTTEAQRLLTNRSVVENVDSGERSASPKPDEGEAAA
jgi:hypothetical protein